jgi:hypothetical protein
MHEVQTNLKDNGWQAETPLGASCKRLSAIFILRMFGMKEIPLTQGKVALVDDEDYIGLSQYKWYAHNERGHFYVCRDAGKGKDRQHFKMHRQIMSYPQNLEVDHRDHNGLNNQRSNLRICTHAENMRNQNVRATGLSKYKGVTWDNGIGKWKASIMFNYKNYYLGYYDLEIEAAKMYDKKAKEFFGEFAKTNF